MRILTVYFGSINKEIYGIKNSTLAAVSKNNVLLFHWCLYSFSNQLFVCGFNSHMRIFYSYKDVTITTEGLQILTNTRHLIYCGMGHPFIMVISKDLLHLHLLQSAW